MQILVEEQQGREIYLPQSLWDMAVLQGSYQPKLLVIKERA